MTGAIEFRCDTCGKLLRTGPENAGRPASCPACGDRIEVPHEVGQERHVPVHVAAEPFGPGVVQPHRGGLVLAFGILSWAVCFPFGVAAWAIAAQDLKAMRAGHMDPSGESLTRAGLILGAANVILGVLILIGMVGVAGAAAFFH